MKNRIIILVISLLFGTSTINLSAQQVLTENGYVVIDCTTIPANARRTTVHTSGALEEHDNMSAEWNSIAFQKFAISATDINTNGTAGSATMQYSTAKSACNTYTGPTGTEAGKWRLPSQREMDLVVIMLPKLKNQQIFTALLAKDYWTATFNYSSNKTQLFGLINNLGILRGVYYTTNYLYVRCVREF